MASKIVTKKEGGTSKRKSNQTKPSIVRSVGPEMYFFLADGRPLKNLLELADALEEMTDEIFQHHVNEQKNDFAKWVSDVFGDEELALKLGHAKSKAHHQLIILKHIIRRLIQ
jgi:hypothetical protein